MIQAVLTFELHPESDNPDEAILEGIIQANGIVREINKTKDYPKMELLTVRSKRDGVTIGDLRSIDEARELRELAKGNCEYDECDENFV